MQPCVIRLTLMNSLIIYLKVTCPVLLNNINVSPYPYIQPLFCINHSICIDCTSSSYTVVKFCSCICFNSKIT